MSEHVQSDLSSLHLLDGWTSYGILSLLHLHDHLVFVMKLTIEWYYNSSRILFQLSSLWSRACIPGRPLRTPHSILLMESLLGQDEPPVHVLLQHQEISTQWLPKNSLKQSESDTAPFVCFLSSSCWCKYSRCDYEACFPTCSCRYASVLFLFYNCGWYAGILLCISSYQKFQLGQFPGHTLVLEMFFGLQRTYPYISFRIFCLSSLKLSKVISEFKSDKCSLHARDRTTGLAIPIQPRNVDQTQAVGVH